MLGGGEAPRKQPARGGGRRMGREGQRKIVTAACDRSGFKNTYFCLKANKLSDSVTRAVAPVAHNTSSAL